MFKNGLPEGEGALYNADDTKQEEDELWDSD